MPTSDLAARRCAFHILADVLDRRRPLDEALERCLGAAELAARDRGFVRNLTAVTLRRLGQIDAMIDHCLERPMPAKARPARHLLRLGTAQVQFTATAAHAAVDTAVRLADELGLVAYKKLVNAVLRRLVREGEALAGAQDAARLNTPDWLWQSWRQAYGDDLGRRIAAAHLGEAPLDLSLKSSVEDEAGWTERLGAERLPGATLRRRSGGAVTELPGFGDGAWWVQDLGARLVAGLLGDVRDKAVIDLCAAPGGKTALLADGGGRVTAVDRSEQRLRRLSENLRRLGLEAETVAADAVRWRPAEPADAVLLDAPCSATGTIRRHPDIQHLKTAEDVAKLADLQGRLLGAAFDMVKPGGVLVFCTCSLQPEEGPTLIARFTESVAAARLVAIGAGEVAGFGELIADDGAFRSLPCHLADIGGIDGFYAARLVRN